MCDDVDGRWWTGVWTGVMGDDVEGEEGRPPLAG